jgi:hypothetical protein
LQIKALPRIVKDIRAADPLSAVGESLLSALINSGDIPYTYHGNRLVADAESVVPALNRLLGLDENSELPQIRTIREAAAGLKRSRPEMGIGEKLIRNAVKDGRIPSIHIGNRDYIAMQSFDEPYCQRIFELNSPKVTRAEIIKRDVIVQMAETIARNQAVPTVIRVRRAG